MNILHFVPIIFAYISICSCDPSNGVEPWKRVKLRAVTKFEGIEDYYIELQQQKLEKSVNVEPASPSVSTPRHRLRRMSFDRDADPAPIPSKPIDQPENVGIKKSICRHVFLSDYFDNLEEEWIDPEQRVVYSELRRRQSGLFKEIFSKRSLRLLLKRPLCFGPVGHNLGSAEEFPHRYVNPLKSRSISIKGRTVQEYFFVCLVRKRESPQREIKKYFVSEEYNVNAAYDRNPESPYITGRFIFEHDSNKNLVITALAEEPAKVLAQGMMAEIDYAEMKRESKSQETQDPIRTLAPAQMVRLCATIFGSSPFEDQVKYKPTADDLNQKCESRTVSFVNEDAIEIAPKKMYQEWTVACKPSERQGSSNLIKSAYYVSGAEASNRIFVYAWTQGKTKYLYAEYHFDYTSTIWI